MGSRKKAKKKVPAARKLLRTPFMAAFHKKLIFDRSKPATRRWCMSTLCGNRMKTRTYRERHRQDLPTRKKSDGI